MKKLILAFVFLSLCTSEIPAVPGQGGKHCPPHYRSHHNSGYYNSHYYSDYRNGPGHYYVRYHPYGYNYYPRGYDYNRRWFDFYFNDYGDRRFEGWYH